MNSSKKVYINPNFNIPQKHFSAIANNKMHVNPLFSQQMLQNKTRIFVNPNFVNSYSTHHKVTEYPLDLNKALSDYVPQITYNAKIANNEIKSNPFSLTKFNNMLKSKYSLVRPNTTQVLRSQENVKPPTTMQINKYKSVTISNYKKTLDTVKITPKNTDKTRYTYRKGDKSELSAYNKTSTTISSQYSQNLIKQNAPKMFSRSKFVYRKLSNDLSKVELKTSKNKPKVLKRSLKKNNIPCPLFKKYGKCLRTIHGKCDFLHDKKHVSICRKFVKGICHDTNCLLSHDMTTKKMPTCYFYLKGMCSRDRCPYLHVKLNEKSKVCPEFLKGYCENGDKCLYRHVGVYKSVPKNSNLIKKQGLCSSKTTTKSSYLNNKSNNKNKTAGNFVLNLTKHTVCRAIEPPLTIDSRYYKEVPSSNNQDVMESTEVIKPTRCKIGTLPSFIKL